MYSYWFVKSSESQLGINVSVQIRKSLSRIIIIAVDFQLLLHMKSILHGNRGDCICHIIMVLWNTLFAYPFRVFGTMVDNIENIVVHTVSWFCSNFTHLCMNITYLLLRQNDSLPIFEFIVRYCVKWLVQFLGKREYIYIYIYRIVHIEWYWHWYTMLII